MYLSIVDEEDLELLHAAISAAIDEANEREIELTVTELTVRLFDAYVMGERDPEKLAAAILLKDSTGTCTSPGDVFQDARADPYAPADQLACSMKISPWRTLTT